MLKNYSFTFACTSLIILLLFGVNKGFAQRSCGTVDLQQKTYGAKLIQNQSKFEEWLRTKKINLTAQSISRKASEPYTIPVVVHIIHNGESLGNGVNIPDAQVLSQIKVLNDDFKRLNVDAANTPTEFASVAGSMNIEFVLAKRDPDGLATTGIVRVNGHKSSWSMNDNYQLKSVSNWPSEDYLNIWVCNLAGYLGYAQFPVSDLPGLEDSPDNALTDGVVIAYDCFGSIDDGNFTLADYYDKGRTTTHEVSHFFGLKHIWGDDGSSCSGSDYVDDTPNQSKSSQGCPSHPTTSCGVTSMFQNFMDYTDDACMNLFTEGQIDRMAVVIESSPRRASLLTSNGLNPPDPVPNDIGIRKILSPGESHCGGTVTPSIEVYNYGTNAITETTIQLFLNGDLKETKTFSLNIGPGETAALDFNDQVINGESNEIAFEVLSTNGVADGDAISNKNLFVQAVYVPATVSLPFNEKFESFPSDWRIINPDQKITWEVTPAPRETLANKALGLNFRRYETQGEQDVFYTPLFSLATADTGFFFVDHASAQFEDSEDVLKIYVVKGCEDLSDADLVFQKSGDDLSTAGKVSSAFQPQETGDWKRNFIDLSDYIGESELQLAFVGINNFGNNLFLDNLTVTDVPNKDVAIKDVSPKYVTCDASPPLSIRIEKTGSEDVSSVTAQIALNGSVVQTQTFTNLTFDSKQQTVLNLDPIALNAGVNNLAVEISAEESELSDESDNNSFSRSVVSQQQHDVIPLRLTFEDDVHTTWTNFNIHSESGKEWKISEVYDGERAIHFDAFSNTTIGDEAWFVSPVLDFRRAKEASLEFDISYKVRSSIEDVFSVQVSKDCGQTFQTVDTEIDLFAETETEWEPQSPADWINAYANLSDYAGEENVLVAFTITNANGNNLFIDSIEFYLTDAPGAIEVEEPFNIYGYQFDDPAASELKISFDLQQRTDVNCTIINTMGQLVSEVLWFDVLNQTYDLPLDNKGPGVYIVRLNIGEKMYQERILVAK